VGSFKNSIGISGNFNKKFASTTKNYPVKSPTGGHRSMQDRYTIRHNDRPKKYHHPEHDPLEIASLPNDTDSEMALQK
jgi:hypothetical protein